MDVDDEGILSDALDKKIGRLNDGYSFRESMIDAKIRVVRDKPYYGPGAHLLMQLIDEEQSVRKACIRMGLSYSRGRSILANIEQQLGCSVLERRQGGRAG